MLTKLLKTTWFRIAIIALAAILILSCVLVWYLLQPKFHDLTLELGAPAPGIADFQTGFTVTEWVTQQTPAADIHMDRVGRQTVTFSYLFGSHSVELTIQDTTAPQVTFNKDITAYIDHLPAPEDFVDSVTDHSTTTVSLKKPLTPPQSYGSESVEVIVTDASGNAISQVCTVHYVWLEREFALELGQQLTKEDLLLNPEKDADLLNQEDLDRINVAGPGTYTITSTDGDHACTCVITVADTTAPTLELNKISIYLTEPLEQKDFIKSVSDVSDDVTVTMVSTLDLNKEGIQTVTFEAVDANGNVTRVDTTLEIKRDTIGPAFSGMGELSVEKHSTPDFEKGVSAVDARDGKVAFSVNTDKVNLHVAGTYYAVYTASDSLGNTTTYRRKVVVNHDQEDTDALAASIAATLPNNAEALRDYVRNKIRYSYNWGGDDPVWYGFKNKSGNCYVHALCLESLLKAKGFETKLIWVTDKSHYWNLVKIDGTWYHIDSTPGTRHTKYSLMNDAQRYETLKADGKQRDWDRTNPDWPACP